MECRKFKEFMESREPNREVADGAVPKIPEGSSFFQKNQHQERNPEKHGRASTTSSSRMSRSERPNEDKSSLPTNQDGEEYDTGTVVSSIVYPGAVRVPGIHGRVEDMDDGESIAIEGMVKIDHIQTTQQRAPSRVFAPDFRNLDNKNDAETQPEKVHTIPRATFYVLAVVFLVAIVLGVSLGVVHAKSSSSSSTPRAHISPTARPYASPTASPTTSRSLYITTTLEQQWKGTPPWTQVGTPQSKAFDWLANKDTFDVQILTPHQVLERYVLAVLYFHADQTQGGSASLSYFLHPVSVCNWTTTGDSSGSFTGIGCRNGTLVTDIQLSK